MPKISIISLLELNQTCNCWDISFSISQNRHETVMIVCEFKKKWVKTTVFVSFVISFTFRKFFVTALCVLAAADILLLMSASVFPSHCNNVPKYLKVLNLLYCCISYLNVDCSLWVCHPWTEHFPGQLCEVYTWNLVSLQEIRLCVYEWLNNQLKYSSEVLSQILHCINESTIWLVAFISYNSFLILNISAVDNW